MPRGGLLSGLHSTVNGFCFCCSEVRNTATAPLQQQHQKSPNNPNPTDPTAGQGRHRVRRRRACVPRRPGDAQGPRIRRGGVPGRHLCHRRLPRLPQIQLGGGAAQAHGGPQQAAGAGAEPVPAREAWGAHARGGAGGPLGGVAQARWLAGRLACVGIGIVELDN